jgi:hypothetical protein
MFKKAVFSALIALTVFAAPASPNRTEKAHSEYTFARVEFNMDPFNPGLNRERQPAWKHDYSKSEDFFLSMVAQVSGVHTNPESFKIVQLDSDEIFKYPFLYFSEPGYWEVTEAEAKNLREYFKRGGFAMFDDFRGRALDNLQLQLQRVAPEYHMERLEVKDPIFSTFFDIDSLEMPPPYMNSDSGKPTFWGMRDEQKRLIMIANADNDFGEFWEDIDNGSEVLHPAVQSFQFGVNYLIYAMTH